MRIAVIGATGNVGTAVLHALRSDHELVGVARRVPEPAPPYDTVDWHTVDIARPGAPARLADAIAGADAVVHLAWILQPNRDLARLQRTNVGGARAVLDAVAAAHVPRLVVASSVGAYSAGPKRRAVGEDWPTGGIHTSHYGRQKAAVERMLDRFERDHPDVAVARIRPGLVMHGEAGAEVARLFLGPLIPTWWLDRIRLPVLPLPSSAISQVVHASDLAEAFRLVVERHARGAFNVAADPVVDPELVARVLGTRTVPVRRGAVRALLDAAWRLRIEAADPGWLDLATHLPVMSTERARTELGWAPRVDAADALREMVAGVAHRASVDASPALRR